MNIGKMNKNSYGDIVMFFRLIGVLVVIVLVGILLLKTTGGDLAVAVPDSAQSANQQTAIDAGIDVTNRVKAGQQLHEKAGAFMQQQEAQKKQMEALIDP